VPISPRNRYRPLLQIRSGWAFARPDRECHVAYRLDCDLASTDHAYGRGAPPDCRRCLWRLFDCRVPSPALRDVQGIVRLYRVRWRQGRRLGAGSPSVRCVPPLRPRIGKAASAGCLWPGSGASGGTAHRHQVGGDHLVGCLQLGLHRARCDSVAAMFTSCADGRGRRSQLSRWLRAQQDSAIPRLARRQTNPPGGEDLATALAAVACAMATASRPPASAPARHGGRYGVPRRPAASATVAMQRRRHSEPPSWGHSDGRRGIAAQRLGQYPWGSLATAHAGPQGAQAFSPAALPPASGRCESKTNHNPGAAGRDRRMPTLGRPHTLPAPRGQLCECPSRATIHAPSVHSTLVGQRLLCGLSEDRPLQPPEAGGNCTPADAPCKQGRRAATREPGARRPPRAVSVDEEGTP